MNPTYFFSGWELPVFDKLVEHVPHGTALDLLDAVREELAHTFAAFAHDGEWDHSTPWEGHHGAHFSWVPRKVEDMWEEGFPVEITLTPDNLAAAFKAGLKDHESNDGTIVANSRGELMASLADWRRAIDEAEAALNEHP